MSNSSKIPKIEKFLDGHYKIERCNDWNKYQGIDQDTKERVSFTIIYNLLESKFNIWRVLEEMQKNSEFNHENIANLVNIKTSNQIDKFKSIVFVTERLDTNLREIINSKQELKIYQRRFIIYQILRGLKYLHTGNITHRYLRPEKIMIDRNYNIKIDSFNYDSHYYNHWYRSPESLMNLSNNDAFTTDIWSVGCIFYELITKKPLFTGKTAKTQLSMIVETIGSPKEDDLHFVYDQQQIEYISSLPKFCEVNWDRLIENGTSEEIDLIRMMLKWNPLERISVEEAMKHSYFDMIDDFSEEQFTCSPVNVSYPKRMRYDKLPNYLWNKIQEIRENKNFK